jgi:hypothetical protein
MKRFAIFLLVGTMFAADAKPLPKELAQHMIIVFQRAGATQTQKQAADDAYNAAVAEWNAVVKEAIKSQGLPEGTTFRIDSAKEDVTPVLPAPTPAEKPADKK